MLAFVRTILQSLLMSCLAVALAVGAATAGRNLDLAAAPSAARTPPFTVASAQPDPDLTSLFRYDEVEATRHECWTGGDAAHSIPLGNDRILWLFGDTFVGLVRETHRADFRMPHNTAAWQQRGAKRLRFFWSSSDALLRPPGDPSSYYWPGDGTVVGDSLYLFCMRVRQTAGPPGFDFDWYRNDLIRVRNAQAEPTAWQSENIGLPSFPDHFQPGAAVAVDGDWIYAYGFVRREGAAGSSPSRVLGVARVSRQQLAKGADAAWDVWGSDGRGRPSWSGRPAHVAPLFDDAAPEMSVGRVRGLSGWVATYSPGGLSPLVAVRYAPRPEGPWSAPLIVYRCPEATLDVLLYGARAHAEVGTEPLQMKITYCRNAQSLERHTLEPRLYGPQGVDVRLRTEGRGR